MFGSEILEVAIGLVFIFFSCSVVCSGIYEAIARVWNIRANNLENRLKKLLGDTKLVKEILQHPLVEGITAQSLLDKILGNRPARPASIPNDILTDAVTDLVCQKVDIDKHTISEIVDTLYQEAKEEVQSNKSLKSIATIVDKEVVELKDQIVHFRERVHNWFDDGMNATSKWYKRKVRFVIFFIAAIMCGWLNIDSIMITKALYTDDNLRAGVVEAVEVSLPTLEDQFNAVEEESRKNETAGAEEAEESRDTIKEAQDALIAAKESLNKLNEDLKKLDIPIDRPYEKGKDFKYWFFKIIGLLLSTLAISMGAPFWFSILRQMMAIRGSTKKKK